MNVRWLKDGTEISISRWNSPKNLDGDYSIRLDENSESPQGDYLCAISFPDLEDKVQILHKVFKMPVIISKPNNVQLENDESSITLDCVSKVACLHIIACFSCIFSLNLYVYTANSFRI